MTARQTAVTGGKKRGRSRSRAADEAILRATLQVLAERGYGNLTAGAVISRAGVSSATLYRRWASLGDLVAAALETLNPEPVSIDNGSLDLDLEEFIRYLGDSLARDNRTGDWSESGVKVDRELRRLIEKTFVAPRKALLGRILRAAQRRGELRKVPPVDDCWSFIAGPIHHRIFIRNRAFTPAFARSMTAMALAGLQALGR